MQIKTNARSARTLLGAFALATLAAATLSTTGCGVGLTALSNAPVATPGVALHGRIFGGQQPVAGATIQLYAASTAGYGSSSYALLATPVFSDSLGGFNITGNYTCPSSSSQVYMAATGGNPGSGVNSAVAMMAGLGPCGNLTATTNVVINEVSTVATVYALSPFMSGSVAAVGTSSANVQGLANAFATVSRLVNVSNGQAGLATLPAGAVGPVAQVNTLGNILASCINTAGPSSAPCTTLFSKAVSGTGTQPTDTVGAILNIARNPGQNVSSLFALNLATGPFQPSMTADTDFTLTIKYKPTLNAPSAAAINANGDVWITNAGNNTLSVVSAQSGATTVYPNVLNGLATPSGIAFDASGNAWISNRAAGTNTSKGSLSVANSAGLFLNTVNTTGPLSGVAVNGAGQIVAADQGASTVDVFTPNGTNPGTATSYSTGGVSSPTAVAINPN